MPMDIGFLLSRLYHPQQQPNKRRDIGTRTRA
jgi:hypothetical protein